MQDTEKPLGSPIPLDQQSTPTTPPTTPKKSLNWKGFFLGILVVVLIEWFAIKALNNGDPYVLPTITPTTPPSPTTIKNQTTSWKSFTDTALGFSFLYPTSGYIIETTQKIGIGTINIQSFKENDQEKYLFHIFEPNEYTYLKASIEKGTPFSSLQPGKKDEFKTLKLGTNNFVRIYPIVDPTCQCDQIKYITIVKDTYLMISVARQYTASVTPEATKTEQRQNALKEQFSDIEKILATFKTAN